MHVSDDLMAERPAEGPQAPRKKSFKGTGFLRLWTGESISLAGTEITFMAIGIIAVTTLAATPWQMGVLEAAESAAVLFLGLSAGVWADRYERRRIMLVANLARSVLVLAIPVLFWFDLLNMAVLYVVVFLVGALSLLFDSAMSAYLPRLLPRSQLERANSWMEGSASVGMVAGPGLAGILVQIVSAPVALVVDSVSYLMSYSTLAGLPKAPPSADPADEEGHGAESGKDGAEETHRAQVLKGLRVLVRDRYQRPMTLAAAHFNIFHSMFFAVNVLFLLTVLDFSPGLLGATSMAGGVAGLVGASCTPFLTRRLGQGPSLILVYAVPGLAAVLVPLSAGAGREVAVVLVSVSTFVYTFAVVVNLVISDTVKQTLVPDHLLGRVTASTRFISWGVQPVGALLGGWLGTRFGLIEVMVTASVGLVAAALWPLFSPVRTLIILPGDGDGDGDGNGEPEKGPAPVEGGDGRV
ncbi:MFS transporter [Streptomyces diastaticus]|uniref:MFS transporter n=1 Tax=Streptomyces diastaticus TaxID=1956 RepID=UPI003666D33F